MNICLLVTPISSLVGDVGVNLVPALVLIGTFAVIAAEVLSYMGMYAYVGC